MIVVTFERNKKNKMKNILVPTDFSDFALNASKLAAEIARKTGAKLYFLHVVNIPSHETGVLPFQDAQNVAEGLFILKHVRKKFQQLFAMDFLKGLTVVEAIQFDGIYESVVSIAKKQDIDLIVMGTHGTSGFVNDFFIGSNTDKIVRLSEIPVIAVKDEVSKADFKRIVFAADFDSGVNQAFREIKKIVDIFDAEVHLVRVVTREDFYFSKPMLEIMEDFAKEEGIKNYKCHIFNAENVQQGINEFARTIDAQMITTATHGRRGLARLFNGSVTGELLSKSSLPVLTAKIQK
jgi:nucleotide-binding universal stress UspA family protein